MLSHEIWDEGYIFKSVLFAKLERTKNIFPSCSVLAFSFLFVGSFSWFSLLELVNPLKFRKIHDSLKRKMKMIKLFHLYFFFPSLLAFLASTLSRIER
jgi:hypothetical protein